MNVISKITRRDIFDVLTNGIEEFSFLDTKRIPFWFWGTLSPVEFLKRLYQLDQIESLDSRYQNAETEIYIHTEVNPNDYQDGWLFEDDRFPLKDGSDEELLQFLCEIFHPEVRDEKSPWKNVLEKVRTLIFQDGYEFYINGLISRRTVYAWRKTKDALVKITKNEIDSFINLFNRGGYVLDFYTPYFNRFTLDVVGVPLCDYYGLSKGKSLECFVNEWKEDDVIKLLIALFDYYMQNSKYEEERGSSEYVSIVQRCSVIIKRLKSNITIVKDIVEDLKFRFSSEYMNTQLNLMQSMQKDYPTEAIGKAKELIESCCKTILEDDGIVIDVKWNVNQLVDATVKHLKVVPKNIPNSIPEADSIKAILGNLKAIAVHVATLRNSYGSGHGKPASFKGLEERHAKLAVGSAAVLVDFLWCTHERK